MAIGSAPEIGYEFTMWGRMSQDAQRAWWQYMRTHWIEPGNLYAGEASIVYPDPVKRAQYCSEIMEEVNAQNIQ